MKKIVRLSESELVDLVKKVLVEQEKNEGPLDKIGDFYRGVKGIKRGYGMDYFQNMSRLERLVKKLKKLDEPNVKIMAELSTLKSKVANSKMPQDKKDIITNFIDGSIHHFNQYNLMNDQIISQIGVVDLDSW